MSVTLTGGPAVTSCFGFIGHMVMFWVGPFFFSLPGNKQTTAGTVEDNSDLTFTGMTGFMLELVYLFKTLLCLQKCLLVWEVDDKPAGIHHSRLWCCWCGFSLTLKYTTGGPKTSCFTLLPTSQSCPAKFWPIYDLTNWFAVLTQQSISWKLTQIFLAI